MSTILTTTPTVITATQSILGNYVLASYVDTVPSATQSILCNPLLASYVDTHTAVSMEMFMEECYSAKTIALVLDINAVKLKYFSRTTRK
eukprot:460726-Ditylum_brightwellii.AAC.1